jgi:hypothetical protein
MGKRNGIGRGTRMGVSRWIRVDWLEVGLVMFAYLAAFMSGYHFGRYLGGKVNDE